MRTVFAFGFVVTFCVLSGCAKEELVAYLPEIEVSADTEMNYASVSTETIDGEQVLVVDLGDVPINRPVKASFVVECTTPQALRVSRVEYVDNQVIGGRWDEPIWRLNRRDQISKVPPFTVPGAGSRLLEIPFTPLQEGAASGMIVLESNAQNGATRRILIRASGIFYGEPDIELAYSGRVAPNVEEDCTDGVCTIPETNAIELGNIGLNEVGTSQITIRNRSSCDPNPSLDVCTTCQLVVDKNESEQGVGVGFKEGTNEEGLFSFVGSTGVPFVVAQKDVDCGSDGQVKLLINFHAPEEVGIYGAVIVVESNDPDEGVIEIPVKAVARNSPKAIAQVRQFDPINPSAPYSDPSHIEPLERVFLDGRESYDPTVELPDDPNALPYYKWEVVEAPAGVFADDVDWIGADTALPSMWVPIAGHYVVRLTVRNELGIESGDTIESRVEFEAIPSSSVHVQLIWDHPSNDQDLHFVNIAESENICHKDWDCYWYNCKAVDTHPVHWFAEEPVFAGPNPRLDRDDTNGEGPENINVDEPNPGRYRIFVHYWSGSSSTVNTVRIYLNGVLRFDQERTLSASGQVWAVADVEWVDDGSDFGAGTVMPYPNSEGGQVGSVAEGLDYTSCSSYTGWEFPN